MTAPGRAGPVGLGDGAEEAGQARTARKRTGRRPGNTESRQLILNAARVKFAQHGYEGASIRSIAQEAGVDTALIHHFFLSKDGLFAASVHDAVHPEEIVTRVLGGRRRAVRGLGERLVREFLELWEAESSRDQLSSILRSAMTHEGAAQLLRRFFTESISVPLARSVGKPDPEIRAVLVTSQLVGLALTRYVVLVHPIEKLPVDDLVAYMGPTVQRYLTGALPASVAD